MEKPILNIGRVTCGHLECSLAATNFSWRFLGTNCIFKISRHYVFFGLGNPFNLVHNLVTQHRNINCILVQNLVLFPLVVVDRLLLDVLINSQRLQRHGLRLRLVQNKLASNLLLSLYIRDNLVRFCVAWLQFVLGFILFKALLFLTVSDHCPTIVPRFVALNKRSVENVSLAPN